MKKQTITIPKHVARLMRAYMLFNEEARKQGKMILLRDFVAFAQEQGRTMEKNGQLGLKDITFNFTK